jgi:hypothetical protein
MLNTSGSNVTFSITAGWKTNFFSPVPPALTNLTWTKMLLDSVGPTSSSALQSNVFVAFEYYK